MGGTIFYSPSFFVLTDITKSMLNFIGVYTSLGFSCPFPKSMGSKILFDWLVVMRVLESHLLTW